MRSKKISLKQLYNDLKKIERVYLFGEKGRWKRLYHKHKKAILGTAAVLETDALREAHERLLNNVQTNYETESGVHVFPQGPEQSVSHKPIRKPRPQPQPEPQPQLSEESGINVKLLGKKTEFTITDTNKIVTYLDIDYDDDILKIGSFENLGTKGDGVKIMKYAINYFYKKYGDKIVTLFIIGQHIPSHLDKSLVIPYIYSEKYENLKTSTLKNYYVKTYGFKETDPGSYALESTTEQIRDKLNDLKKRM
jgi:hypothetical protein